MITNGKHMRRFDFFLHSLITALCLVILSEYVIAADAINYTDCKSCHINTYEKWQQSDHAHSMSIASSNSVKANFDYATAKHFSLSARFFIKDKSYFAELTEAQKTTLHKIEYTFGYFPLQQYLVKADGGRFQVLPFAWDTRPREAGGQRWYHLYNNEIAPNNRFHWQQPLQNWNGMCADCHSDGLQRSFDLESNTFKTKFDSINVNCMSCHDDKDRPHSNPEPKKQMGGWVLKQGATTAKWVGDARDNNYENACFACHSLRSPLTDGFDSQTPFLDQFTPNWITPPLYYADGQIKEEVFVWGSFNQSKMAQMGVSCIDCHDAHSGKLVKKGNQVCLQCHTADVFDTPKHHGHNTKDEGGKCINCHMPKSVFMGVDARADHAFKIPRPEFTRDYGLPNACTNCHEDQSASWLIDNLDNWFPQRKGPSSLERDIIELNANLTFNHVKLITENPAQPALKKASAIAQLQYLESVSATMLLPFLVHTEPLIRLAATQVADQLTQAEKRRVLPVLLSDKYKSIRVAAAYALVGVLPETDWQETYEKAFKEMLSSHEMSGWRGEALMMYGNVGVRMQDVSKALFGYEYSTMVDPYFTPAYINLANLYRRYGNTAAEERTFKLGIDRNPEDAELYYHYALYHVRAQQLHSALTNAKTALSLDPTNARNAYLYLLTLDGVGQRERALRKIDVLINQLDNNQQLVELKRSWLR